MGLRLFAPYVSGDFGTRIPSFRRSALCGAVRTVGPGLHGSRALTPESEQTTWRAIEAGIRCESYLKALELFSGSAALTPALTDRIAAFLAAHGEYLLRASGVFQRLSNWGVLQDHGLLLAGIYLGNEMYVQTALRRLSAELSLQVMDDGTHWEQSPMYHGEVLHCAMDSVLIARRNGIAVPDVLEERVHAMARALSAWVKSDGRIPCQSDSDDTDARDLLCEAALLFRDGQLRARAAAGLPAEAIWNLGAQAQQELNALSPLPAVHPSDALPDSGNYMLRSGLGADAVNLRFTAAAWAAATATRIRCTSALTWTGRTS